jgi:hypothetical protein
MAHRGRRFEIERVITKSSRRFKAVVGSLEAAIGHPDMTEFTKATENAPSFAEIERVVHRNVGRSGLMPFIWISMTQMP